MKTALVLTDDFENIKNLVTTLSQNGWTIIVDEQTYARYSYYTCEAKESKDRVPGLTHPYAYTSYDLDLGDPLALVHWKFIDGLSTAPCDLAPTIDLFYCDPQYSRNGLAIGQILMAAVDRKRVFVMTDRSELESHVHHYQT